MKEKRIYIIEGIPGAGKDALQKRLSKRFRNHKNVHVFSEEELLSSWKHVLIPKIENITLNYFHTLLNYIGHTLKKDKDCIFILNRFHISLLIAVNKLSKTNSRKYRKLLLHLRKLPVMILVPILKEKEIEKRSLHPERKEKAWKLHLKKWLNHKGFKNLKDAFMWEQQEIMKILKKQKIPYALIKIKES